MKPFIRSSVKTPRRRLISFLTCALLLTGQPVPAQLPTLGDGSDMSLAAERKIGDRIAKEIYRDPDYLDDPLLADYLQSIWQPLQTAARVRGELSADMEERFAWGLLLVRDRSINAFALPGGYMGVHTGLIGLVANRDELASVLAHELSHVTQRHISRGMTQQSKEAPWMLAAMILGVLAASKSPNAANAMITGGQAVAVQSQLNFSRDMEREADRVGFNVMTQAGYQPRAFVTMFEKLQLSSRLNDTGAYPYLRSHPLTSQRIADMQLRVKEGGDANDSNPTSPTLPPTGMASAAASSTDLTHSMMAARARILSDPGVDALRAWVAEAHARPTQTSLASPARHAASLYSAVMASMKLRELPQAQQFLDRLTNLVRFDASAARLVRLLAVEVALQKGDVTTALTNVDTQATDRAELFLLAQVAVALKKETLNKASGLTNQGGARISDSSAQLLANVLQRLQAWVTTHPKDASAWQQLSHVAAAQNLVLRGIYAEAEAQAASLDYVAAVDRFKAGQDFARQSGWGSQPGDHIEASIIDTRLREVQALSRELLREQAPQR